MAIITLTTDLGTKDYYLSTVKGAILCELPGATIVDISHDIPKFNILEGAFVLKNSYRSFPEGTVHIVGINPQDHEANGYVAVHANGHYFVGADNGLFTILFDGEPEKIVSINFTPIDHPVIFPTREIFVKAACHIASGGKLDAIGKEKKALLARTMLRAIVDGQVIRGNVIYVDSYENVFTNISETLFKETAKERPFTLFLKQLDYTINTISPGYNEVPEGEMLALFSNSGFLEISINKGHAGSLLGLKPGDMIRVEFEGV